MALGRGKKKDWRVRVDRHPCITTEYEVNAHLRSLIDISHPMVMEMGDKPLRYKVIEYHDTSLFVGCPKIFQVKFKALVGEVIRVSFFSEGKRWYFPAKVLGFGKYKGDEAVRLEFPGFLQIEDDHNLTDLFLDGNITFQATPPGGDEPLEAKLLCIGKDGIDFQFPRGFDPRESVQVGDEVAIDLPLPQGPTLQCRPQAAYFLEDGDEIFLGARFPVLETQIEKALGAWILMIRRMNKGGADQVIQSVELPEPTGPVRKKRDHHPVIHEGDPGILIAYADEDRLYALADLLQGHYGVFKTVGVLNDMVTLARRFKPQLILLDTGLEDAHDLARRFRDSPKGEIPLVMMGDTAEDGRDLAVKHGAVDFLPVTPMTAEPILAQLAGVFERFKAKEKTAAPDLLALGKDFPAVIHEGEPPLLLASEDAELLGKLGELLKGSFGVYQTRGAIANLDERAREHAIELVLLHDTLGTQSGFDRCRKFTAEKMPDMPVLMMGEPDRTKHNQALQCGAVDYLNLDFDQPQAMLDKVREVYELFHHDEETVAPEASVEPPVPPAAPAPAPEPKSEPVAKPAAQPLRDYRPLLVPGSPVVLVVSRDEALIEQLGLALKGHFGVYRSKGLPGKVELLMKSFAVKLLLVHEELGLISGLELCREISSGPLADAPVVVMGDGARGKQPNAVQHGAVDYLTIQPFDPAAALAKIRQVYELFFHEPEPVVAPKPVARAKPVAPSKPVAPPPVDPPLLSGSLVSPYDRQPSGEEEDYNQAVLHAGEPYILLAARNPALLNQLAGALKNRYGILITKGAPDKVETLISLYEPQLILLHENLGEFTGFQVCKEITSGHHEDTPVVIMGGQADAKGKQKQALMEGAVEFLMVEPFIEQLVVSHVRDVLAMFH